MPQIYAVTGDSMAPSFCRGDLLLVSRSAYPRSTPGRGDVVVVRDPGRPEVRYLKRVVGLAGEIVRLQDGLVLIDGAHLTEPYLGGLPASLGLGEDVWRLGRGEYFVMGDNRAHSTDSRHFGPVDVGLIVGKAWFRLWPPRRWGAVSK